MSTSPKSGELQVHDTQVAVRVKEEFDLAIIAKSASLYLMHSQDVVQTEEEGMSDNGSTVLHANATYVGHLTVGTTPVICGFSLHTSTEGWLHTWREALLKL